MYFARIIGDTKKYIFIRNYTDFDNDKKVMSYVIEDVYYNGGVYDQKHLNSIEAELVVATTPFNVSKVYCVGTLIVKNGEYFVHKMYAKRKSRVVPHPSLEKPLHNVIICKLKDGEKNVFEFVQFW